MSLTHTAVARTFIEEALQLAIAVTEVDLVKATIRWDKETIGHLDRQLYGYKAALAEVEE